MRVDCLDRLGGVGAAGVVTIGEVLDLALRLGLDRVPAWCRANGIAVGPELDAVRQLHLPAPTCTHLQSRDAPADAVHGDGVPSVLTTEQVADQLQVSPRTVAGLVARGDLQATRIGRSVRFLPAEVEDFLRRATSTGGAQEPEDGAP